MKTDAKLCTRRDFLRTSALGGAVAWTIPTFLANTFASLHAEAKDANHVVTGKDGTILVVLQMAGGNDGLNTVVPYSNDYYKKARKRIALDAKSVLKINDDIGLHPTLTGLKELYDAGSLGI